MIYFWIITMTRSS